MGLTEEEEMAEKIGIEERKLMIAQRKLESIRVLDELLERVKVICIVIRCCKIFSVGWDDCVHLFKWRGVITIGGVFFIYNENQNGCYLLAKFLLPSDILRAFFIIYSSAYNHSVKWNFASFLICLGSFL